MPPGTCVRPGRRSRVGPRRQRGGRRRARRLAARHGLRIVDAGPRRDLRRQRRGVGAVRRGRQSDRRAGAIVLYLSAACRLDFSCRQGPGWPCSSEVACREAREVFWQEAETASANGDIEALAEAALGLGGIWVHEHRTTLDNARVEALQRQALEALPHDHALARRLRMRLAAERAYRVGHGDDVFTELERARAGGDPVGLAEALSMTHHCLLGPQHTAERAALAEELIAVSPATGRPLDGLIGLDVAHDRLVAGRRSTGLPLTGGAARPAGRHPVRCPCLRGRRDRRHAGDPPGAVGRGRTVGGGLLRARVRRRRRRCLRLVRRATRGDPVAPGTGRRAAGPAR